MTFQEMLETIPTLSLQERKELMHVLVETLTQTEETLMPERIPGLHAGTTWVSEDFDDPLPDEFWLDSE